MNEPSLKLPRSVGAWTQSGGPKFVGPQDIFNYMDGAGEFYLGYRFKRLEVQRYGSADQGEILVELYWMESSDDAYGLLSGDWGGEAVDLPPPTPGSSSLRTWVLDHQVTEIDMKERQFWNFAALQPVAEKPWTTFMGRLINVPDMPQEAQRQLGMFNKNSPGMI